LDARKTGTHDRAHCNDYSAAFTRIRDAVDALPVDDAVIDTAIAGKRVPSIEPECLLSVGVACQAAEDLELGHF
jgi:hypothetical protein